MSNVPTAVADTKHTTIQSFVGRTIPLVSVALGATACNQTPVLPFSSGDTGLAPDTDGTPDTGNAETGRDSGIGGEAGSVIARFCAAAQACEPDYTDCVSWVSESMEYIRTYGAGCYAAYLARLEIETEGDCISVDHDGETYWFLHNDAFDPRDPAIGCTNPTSEEREVAAAFCAAKTGCANQPERQYVCEADVLWEMYGTPSYLTYFACMADATCEDGYLDFTECGGR